MKLYPGSFSLRDLIAADRDPSISISSTPWGARIGEKVMLVKKAVPWKGLRGAAFFAEATRHGKLGEAVKALAQFSRNHAGIKGAAAVGIPGVGVIQMPMKSARQMQAVGKISANDIQSLATRSSLVGVAYTQLSGLRAS